MRRGFDNARDGIKLKASSGEARSLSPNQMTKRLVVSVGVFTGIALIFIVAMRPSLPRQPDLTILDNLRIAFLLAPTVFWYLLVTKYNKRAGASFSPVLYSSLYLVPGVHYLLAWSFVKDILELKIKRHDEHQIPFLKTFLITMALPYSALVTGPYIVGALGIIAAFLGQTTIARMLLNGDFLVSAASFVWLGILLPGFCGGETQHAKSRVFVHL